MTRIAMMAAVAAHLALAGAFLWAALAKALAIGGLRRTIEGLGAGPALAGLVAPAVIGAELAAAVGLLVVPGSWWPRGLVAALALAFACAGLAAVATKKRITCNCFGGGGTALLGWRQVRLLPLWLGLVALAQASPPDWAWREGLAILTAVLLALTISRLPGHLRLVHRLRGDRVALAPSYSGTGSAQPDTQPKAVAS